MKGKGGGEREGGCWGRGWEVGRKENGAEAARSFLPPLSLACLSSDSSSLFFSLFLFCFGCFFFVSCVFKLFPVFPKKNASFFFPSLPLSLPLSHFLALPLSVALSVALPLSIAVSIALSLPGFSVIYSCSCTNTRQEGKSGKGWNPPLSLSRSLSLSLSLCLLFSRSPSKKTEHRERAFLSSLC